MTVKEILDILRKIALYALVLILFVMLIFVQSGGLNYILSWDDQSYGSSGETLDRIDNYAITATVNDDGSVDMDYQITWTVLSDAEGPLTWVKVGVPNSDVDNIQALSDNIKKASYYNENGQDFIRIDFNRSYNAGDTLQIHYSCTQYNMFQSNGATVKYEFMPGWFGSIDVTHYMIKWSDENVQSVSSGYGTADGYYVWAGSLAAGKKTGITITYSVDAYNFTEHTVSHGLSLSRFYEYLLDKDIPIYTAAFIGILFLSLSGALVWYFLIRSIYVREGRYFYGSIERDDYSGGSGHGFHCAGGGGCACACACACAGGGRAGCSAKDLYGTKLESQRVRARLRAAAGKK